MPVTDLAAHADVARLIRLTQYFATEAVRAGDVAAFPPPAALAELPPVELRRLLDGLLTIRPPRPIPDDDVRADLDEMLAAETSQRVLDAGAPDARELPTLSVTHGVAGPLGERVALWRGDLTSLRAGAIVNAANSEMLGCRVPGHTCVDNVVHAVAGPGLRAECAAHMEARGGVPEETGRALLTDGYHLPAEHVVHTVGPIVEGGVTDGDRELLASSYRSVLDAAAGAGLDSVGLCSVSTGAFGYPKGEAARLVLSVLGQWLEERDDARGGGAQAMRIVVCVFAQEDVAAYEAALTELDGGVGRA